MSSLSLPLMASLMPSASADPDDVIVTKRSLERAGQYKQPDWGLTDIPDGELFEGIRRFQKENKLKVDGVMHPGGETAKKLGEKLRTTTHSSPKLHKVSESGDETNERPTPEECDHLFWQVDIPTCRGIERMRGKRGAARCYHSAAQRYGACLAGRPIDELPPLDVWNP